MILCKKIIKSHIVKIKIIAQKNDYVQLIVLNDGSVKMDTTQYGESAYITPDLVKQSTTKRVYIAGDAKIVQGKYGDKLEVPVELDGKPKTWGLNREIVKNLHQFGKDSKSWVGKWVELRIINDAGKDKIMAFPIITPTENIQ